MAKDSTSVFYFPQVSEGGNEKERALKCGELWNIKITGEHKPSCTINVREDEWVGG